MDETQVQLIAEQMKHALDLMRADIEATRATVNHNRDLSERLFGKEEEIKKESKQLGASCAPLRGDHDSTSITDRARQSRQ